MIARLMSEAVSSVHKEDFADEIIRDHLKSSITHGDTPFNAERNPESWKTVKVTAAMIVYALRVQTKCCTLTKASPEATGDIAPSVANGLAEAMRDFVKCQGDQTKTSKKGLSFDRAKRYIDVHRIKFARKGRAIDLGNSGSASLSHTDFEPATY